MSYRVQNQPQQRGYFPVNSGPHSPAASSSSLCKPNSAASARGLPPPDTFHSTPPIRPGSPRTLSSPVHAVFSRPPLDYSQAGSSAFVRISRRSSGSTGSRCPDPLLCTSQSGPRGDVYDSAGRSTSLSSMVKLFLACVELRSSTWTLLLIRIITHTVLVVS